MHVFVLKTGLHDVDSLDKVARPLGADGVDKVECLGDARIAILILLPKPKEEKPGGTTGADESTKKPQNRFKIERELVPSFRNFFSGQFEVGDGFMLEQGEVLHVIDEICVLCIIHGTRTEAVMDPRDDKDWAPSASWTPSDNS